MDEEIFILLCESCCDCDRRAVSVLMRHPTTEQIKELSDSIGGMFCIKVRIFSGKIGEPFEEIE